MGNIVEELGVLIITQQNQAQISVYREMTSICLRVFATSRGHVAAAARLPATKAAEKFAPRILAALASSPTKPRSFFLICKDRDQI